MTAKTIATLKSDINTAIPDNTTGEVDPVDVRDTGFTDSIDSLNTRRSLSVAISIDDTTITDAALADLLREGQWVIVEAFTITAEMRQVSNITGSVITFSRKFVRAHVIGDILVLSQDGRRNVEYWGAEASSPDVVTNVQAGIDDFDYRLDTAVEANSATFTVLDAEFTSVAHGLNNTNPIFLTTDGTLPTPLITDELFFVRDKTDNTFKVASSPNGTAIFGITGGSGTHTWHQQRYLSANNLFFPQGTWTFGASVELPDQDASRFPGTLITGANAIIRTTSFNGPLFTGAARDGGGNNFFTFQDLAFVDETNGLAVIGTATLFDHRLYRLRLHRCTFNAWDHVIKSDDLTLVSDLIQSTRISECSFGICEFIVEVSQAFDFYFCNNQTEFCNKAVHSVITAAASMLVGRICDNTFEGSGLGGQTIRILGGRAVTISGNYLEGNGDASAPEIDMVAAQQPRGIQITGNRFAPNASQLESPTWFPIELNPGSSGVTIEGNVSEGITLIDPSTQDTLGETWYIEGNHLTFAIPTDQAAVAARGSVHLTRQGYVRTLNSTPTDVDFAATSAFAQAFSIGNSLDSVYSVRADIIAINDVTRDDSATYDIRALFRHNSSLGLQKIGVTTRVVEIESDVAWNADFDVRINSAVFTAAVDDIITSVAHGLVNEDRIFLTTTGTLPAPLIAGFSYIVRDRTNDTFKVSLGRGLAAVNIIDIGTVTHTWHQEDIRLVVTGDATDRVDWWADVKISLGPNI